MNIPKAIEILDRFEKGYHRNLSAARHDALKLGIEALERLRNNRNTKPVINLSPLPGETEDLERR